MSPAYVNKHSAGHGIYTALPDLPSGWQWIQSPHDYLIARNPDGTRDYFVDFYANGKFALTRRNTATRWDWFRTLGELPVGSQFMDTRERIFSDELNA